jgi:hypothetical protein
MNKELKTKKYSLLRRLIKNPLFWLTFLVIIYTFTGFVIVPFIAKSYSIKFIKEQYNREAKIESVSFNPYTFTISVKNFVLYDKDKSIFLYWKDLFVDLNVMPLFNSKIELENFTISNPKVVIKKLTDTEFNFSDLLGHQQKTSTKPANSLNPAKEFYVKYSDLGLQNFIAAQSKNNKQKKTQWDFIINRFDIRNINFTFEDKSLDSQEAKLNLENGNLTINKLHLMSKDISTFKLNFKMRDGGNASAEGKFTLEPMYTEAKLNVNKLNFRQTAPYLLKFAYLRLDDGKLNVDGLLKFKMGKENELPDISFNGTAGIDDLVLYDTQTQERFLEWGSLTTTGIAAQTIPMKVTIGEINFYKLYSRIAIYEDQSMNLQKIFKLSSSDSAAIKDSTTTKLALENSKYDNNHFVFISEKKSNTITSQTNFSKTANTTLTNFNFDIGRINIDSSAMFFSDFSLPLKFAAKIHDLNGEIIGISYGNPLGAAVDLKGTVDEYGLARIKGNIDPFDPMGYSDIKTNFNNIELTSLSPYSAKFMGYLIESGKLSLDVQYLIDKGLLTSYSKIFLNKIELGDEVEGQEGFGIPVKLALSLLKDGDGNIDLDLEVEGDLNNPEVNTGTLVWWAVKRVLVSIVSAPFRLLGNLLGINGDDLEFIDFDPGESRLLPNQLEKLINLNKALNERPNITLEIYGVVDTITDSQSIQLKKLKDKFTRQMTAAAKDSLIDPMKVEVSICRKILENMYKESFGAESLDTLQGKFYLKPGQDDPKSAEDFDLRNYLKTMIKQLSDIQPVAQEELMKLATERADAIKNYMLIEQKTKPERLVIKETEIYEQEDRNWVKCRLDIGSL